MEKCNDTKDDDGGEEVISLVVQQVGDDSVEPAILLVEVGQLEPGRSQEEVVHGPQGGKLHVHNAR